VVAIWPSCEALAPLSRSILDSTQVQQMVNANMKDRKRRRILPLLAMLLAAFCPPAVSAAKTIPSSAAIDAEVSRIMTSTRAKGMAVAVIDQGKVAYVHAYGIRNAKGDPLTTDTVTAHQSSPVSPDLPVSEQRKDLYAGLGVVVFDGPQGHGFYKGGHDGQTANTMVCIEAGQRCIIILSNDVRSEGRSVDLVKFILGDTGVPYDWEYGDHAGKS
jgi:hypothetical protein